MSSSWAISWLNVRSRLPAQSGARLAALWQDAGKCLLCGERALHGGLELGIGARDLGVSLAFLHARHDLACLRLVALVAGADLAKRRADFPLVHVVAAGALGRLRS